MRNTLLTTTALVLTAGIASADGHATIGWSGTATAGMAREGSAAAKKAVAQNVTGAAAVVDALADSGVNTAPANEAAYKLQVLVQVDGTQDTSRGTLATAGVTFVHTAAATATEAQLRADNAAMVVLFDATSTMTAAQKTAQKLILSKQITLMDAIFGTDAVAKAAAGDFQTYSEVNATVTGSVTAGGLTLTAAMSVDAGSGYTFADDKGMDSAKTNGVSLDNVSLDMGAMGKIKLDQNAVAHLVDAGDDDTADLLYTNTFGTASFSFAADVSADLDPTAAKAVAATISYADGTATTANGITTATAGTAAVAADVQWSAKVSMPVGTGSVYGAIDEGKGNAFGGSGVVGGITVSFDSKLEALENQIKASRDNTLGLAYTMGSVSTKATYNSVKDGDQWGISATYAADGTSITASTDEGSDWTLKGSYSLGPDASVVGGVNYTEDAYLGLSFSF